MSYLGKLLVSSYRFFARQLKNNFPPEKAIRRLISIQKYTEGTERIVHNLYATCISYLLLFQNSKLNRIGNEIVPRATNSIRRGVFRKCGILCSTLDLTALCFSRYCIYSLSFKIEGTIRKHICHHDFIKFSCRPRLGQRRNFHIYNKESTRLDTYFNKTIYFVYFSELYVKRVHVISIF